MCHCNTNHSLFCLYVLYVSVMHITSMLHHKLCERNCFKFQALAGTTFCMITVYSFLQTKFKLLTLWRTLCLITCLEACLLLAWLKFILSCLLEILIPTGDMELHYHVISEVIIVYISFVMLDCYVLCIQKAQHSYWLGPFFSVHVA